MLALLRKDCYVMGKYMVWFILAWIIMSGMYAWIPDVETGASFYLMPAMASTIALNAVSTDQACRWDLCASMTPLRPWGFWGFSGICRCLSSPCRYCWGLRLCWQLLLPMLLSG